MAERKFTKGLRKPGMAAQLRETVSQVVRESTFLSKTQFVEPMDFESYILRSKTILQNDPQRELLLYPTDDVSQITVPRKYRAETTGLPPPSDLIESSLLTKECVKSYTSDWNLIHYKYSAYSGSYLELPKISKTEDLKDEVYEVDTDPFEDESAVIKPDRITKQGFLMKGPEVGNDRMFANIGSKSFKRRYCYLRQEVDGTYILELHKDERKGEAKATIVMDFCTDVVKNTKRGKLCFELHMAGSHKSYCLAADTDEELNDWVSKLNLVLLQNKMQEEKRSNSLERGGSMPPLGCAGDATYGTLRGLEQSVNPQLMKYSRETDSSIALARRDNRRRLFSVYPFIPFQHSKGGMTVGGSGTLSGDNNVEPYREHFGLRVLVKCESLRFRLQAPDPICQVEPYFATVALFDAKDGKKLTEDFKWTVSSEQVDELVPKPEGPTCSLLPSDVPTEWMRHPNQAVFSVSRPHSEIFLVVRIDKILQGSVAQASEPYMKTNKDPRLALKLHRSIQAIAPRLGKFRMPFAWTARPLFTQYSNQLDIVSEFPGIFRQEPTKLKDEELIKLLAEYRKPDKLNKLPMIPGWITVKVEILSQLPKNSLTCSLVGLKPFPVPPECPPTVEIAELNPETQPYTVFTNHLYVYPLSLAFDSQKTFSRARNIACVVQLKDSDQENSSPLPCIYTWSGELVSSGSCTVIHHATSPSWYDEIKMRLPTRLTPNHHLLFTFLHVSIEAAKKKSQDCTESPVTPVGYAWLPLLSKTKLNIEEQTIPVAANLPSGYLTVQPLGLGKGNSGPEVIWVDNQKAIFTVNLRLLSTVHTTDLDLHNLFAHSEKMYQSKSLPPESETSKILKAGHMVQLDSAICFLPSLLNQLFTLLVTSPSHEVALNCIRLLVHLVSMVTQAGKSDALSTYIKFVFVGESVGGRTVHEEFISHLPSLLSPTNTDFLLINKFLPHSGFFLQIIIKSMAQHLLSTGRIKMHRHERFPTDYLNKLEELLKVLSPYIASKHREMPQETKQLNHSIAHFLKKCLSFVDRGFVFRLISWYVSTFSGDARVLHDFKYSFINIVCSHEHYVSFNLPLLHVKTRNGSGVDCWLSDKFCRQHYLAGLVLCETRNALSQELAARRPAIGTLRDLMAKHELDERYQAKGQLARIASLYLPWLGVVLENVQRLIDTTHSHSPIVSSASSIISTPSNTSNRFTFHQDSVSRTLVPVGRGAEGGGTVLAAIAGAATLNGGSTCSLDSQDSADSTTVSMETAIHRDDSSAPVTTNRHARSVSQGVVVRCEKLQQAEVKDILVCFLFVLKHLASDQLIAFWHNCSHDDLINFFKVIQLCLHEFKYTGRRQIAEGVVSRPGNKSMTLPARMQPPDFSSDPSSQLSGSNSIGRDNPPSGGNKDSERLYQALLEANLATEVGLTVLDCLGLYCLHFREALSSEPSLMPSVFNLYLSFLQVGQSETLFRHVFAALRAFINNFSTPLFKGNASLCGQLCLELLRCCNSRLSAIRQEACALLYLLMRSNFEFSGRKGLTRVHLQVIISVSQLIGNVSTTLNNSRFQESLSLINSYASSDKAMKATGFSEEVKDLTKRTRTVLMATAQMKELTDDSEMLVDLQHSLANSYCSTPELRITWLQAMARVHTKEAGASEAVACQLHIAAILAHYLHLKGHLSWGAEAFQPISSNIPRDEMSLKLDSGMQEVGYSESSLIEQLELCAEGLEKAERYECLYHLYNLVLPLYERKKDYAAMGRAYQTLASACSRLSQPNPRSRLLGRFYRVALYSQAYFESESGVEYVYKEPKVTSLSEISERLLHLYSNKFGANSVKIIMDSAPIVESELDPKMAHIQVTHVTPYWDPVDSELRQTEFEQNHDIRTFMFETPFTQDGKPRGPISEQWKRRTVLTTECTFPYVKKRLRVIKKEEAELSPIEVALDEMRQRVIEIEEVVFSKPTDIKKLQLKLQGSVCVQVNAGPLAYASAFLDPALSPMFPDDKVEELKDIFREFIRVCYAALQLNSRLVRSDQAEYQAALKQNLHKLAQELSNLFSENLWPADQPGSFKRNSQALFSAISGANSSNSSSA